MDFRFRIPFGFTGFFTALRSSKDFSLSNFHSRHWACVRSFSTMELGIRNIQKETENTNRKKQIKEKKTWYKKGGVSKSYLNCWVVIPSTINKTTNPLFWGTHTSWISANFDVPKKKRFEFCYFLLISLYFFIYNWIFWLELFPYY